MDRFTTVEGPSEFGYVFFRQGQRARKNGKLLNYCPYKRGTLADRSWRAGWADADMIIISEDSEKMKPSRKRELAKEWLEAFELEGAGDDWVIGWEDIELLREALQMFLLHTDESYVPHVVINGTEFVPRENVE